MATVCITIVAITEGIEPSKRTIFITPENPIVPIGRASRSPNKGLQAALNNAWFESPVMSRDHAELYLSLENEVYHQTCSDSSIVKKLIRWYHTESHDSGCRLYAWYHTKRRETTSRSSSAVEEWRSCYIRHWSSSRTWHISRLPVWHLLWICKGSVSQNDIFKYDCKVTLK